MLVTLTPVHPVMGLVTHTQLVPVIVVVTAMCAIFVTPLVMEKVVPVMPHVIMIHATLATVHVMLIPVTNVMELHIGIRGHNANTNC